MFITKTSLPRRTFLRGVGRRAGAAAARRDGAGADGDRRRRPRAPQRRLGFVYVPHGVIMDQWTPATAGAGFEFTPILKPLEPFRDSLVVVSNLHARRGDDSNHAVVVGVLAHRRAAEADRRPGLPRRHVDRSGHRAADRPGHDVPVARARHRGLHRAARRVRPRLQLRVHEHAHLADADDAAADGDQPARRVRADVRRRRHGRASGWRGMRDGPQHPRLRRRATCKQLERGLGARDRARLDEYLEHVREIERRIQRAEQQAARRRRRADRAGRRARVVRGARRR